jgi:hypothetical protein
MRAIGGRPVNQPALHPLAQPPGSIEAQSNTAQHSRAAHLHASGAANARVGDVAIASYFVGSVYDHHPPLAIICQHAADLTNGSRLAHPRPACGAAMGASGAAVGEAGGVIGELVRGACSTSKHGRRLRQMAADLAAVTHGLNGGSKSTPLTQQQNAFAALCQVSNHCSAACRQAGSTCGESVRLRRKQAAWCAAVADNCWWQLSCSNARWSPSLIAACLQ